MGPNPEDPELNCPPGTGAVIRNYGSGSGSVLFIKDLKKFYRKKFIFTTRIFNPKTCINPSKKEIFKLRYLSTKTVYYYRNPEGRKKFRAEAGSGAVNQIHSSTEPDPKEIFTTPQTLLSRTLIRIKLLAIDPDQESLLTKESDEKTESNRTARLS